MSGRPGSTGSSQLLFALIGLVCFALYSYLLVSLDPTNDLTIYRAAGRAVAGGGDPYSVGNTTEYRGLGAVDWRYLYPPLLATLLSLFEMHEDYVLRYLWWVWSAVTAFALVVTVRILRELKGDHRSKVVVGLALLIAAWPVTIDGIERGQINIWITALIGVWCLPLIRSPSLRSSSHYQTLLGGAGAAVALATQLKVTPLILALPYLKRGSEHFWRAFFMVSCVSIALSWWIGGSEVWVFYLQSLSAISLGSDGWVSPENLSISKLLVGMIPSLSRSEALVAQSLIMVSAVLAFCAARVKGYWSNQQFAFVLVVVLAHLSPIVWYHHFVWLLFPIIFAWRGSGIFLRSILLITGIGASLYRLVESGLVPSDGFSRQILLVEPVLWMAFCSVLVLGIGRSTRLSAE